MGFIKITREGTKFYYKRDYKGLVTAGKIYTISLGMWTDDTDTARYLPSTLPGLREEEFVVIDFKCYLDELERHISS